MAASVVVAIGKTLGFEVNFAANKTKAFVVNVGARVAEARALLRQLELSIEGAAPMPCIPLSEGGRLRISQVYKHLGVWQSCAGHIGSEISWRCATASAACGALTTDEALLHLRRPAAIDESSGGEGMRRLTMLTRCRCLAAAEAEPV